MPKSATTRLRTRPGACTAGDVDVDAVSPQPAAVATWRRLLRLLVVTALMGVFLAAGPVPTASADGFDCKEVPAPQSPNAAAPAAFDSTSATAPTARVFDETGYGTHGWAGLKWYTFDLGCGEDITGVSLVRSRTDAGNEALTIGESIAAAAFWLDDQANTPAQGEAAGRQGAIAQFDSIVYAVSEALRPAIFGPWLGIGIAVAGLIVLYRGLRSDVAGVTRQLAIGAAALALGGLMVGAPQKAITLADNTFLSIITGTQGQIFDAAGIDGVDGPRLAITDRILIDDIKKGYFGTNAKRESVQELWPKLRMSLAYTYEEQERIRGDNSAQKEIDEGKKKMYLDEVVAPLEENGLSFSTFQGKDSSRVSLGIMAMLKTGMPSILWAGASILKFAALLAVRLAILGAPVWIPFAVVSGSVLTRVFRVLGGIYLWAVAAAVIMSVYLFALIKLYANDNVDETYRLLFLIILTVACWKVLRPFKRLSQTVTQSSHGLIGGALNRRRSGSWKTALRTAGALAAGPVAGLAATTAGLGQKAANTLGKGFGNQWGDALVNPDIAHIRQEGVALSAARTADYRERSRDAHIAALRSGGDQRALPGSDRAAAAATALRTAPLPGGSGTRLPGVDLTADTGGGRHALAELRNETALTGNHDRIDVGNSEVYVPAALPDRWDGGPGATLAPVTVYRPEPPQPRQTGKTGETNTSDSRSSSRPLIAFTRPQQGSTAARITDAAAPAPRPHLEQPPLGRRDPADDLPPLR